MELAFHYSPDFKIDDKLSLCKYKESEEYFLYLKLDKFSKPQDIFKHYIIDLINKGFICRTRSRGTNGIPALYAVTWLSVSKKKGLYLHGFKKDLFLEVDVKKTIPKKVMTSRSNYCSFKRGRSSK